MQIAVVGESDSIDAAMARWEAAMNAVTASVAVAPPCPDEMRRDNAHKIACIAHEAEFSVAVQSESDALADLLAFRPRTLREVIIQATAAADDVAGGNGQTAERLISNIIAMAAGTPA